MIWRNIQLKVKASIDSKTFQKEMPGLPSRFVFNRFGFKRLWYSSYYFAT
jgi:hypothetical protein